jgi:cell wall-associated NlpC family hydrolase
VSAQRQRHAARAWLQPIVRGWRPLLLLTVALGVLLPATAASADPSVSSLDKQIKQQSAALEQIIEQYNKVNEQLKASKAAADQLTAQVQASAAELDTASVRIGEIAAEAYKGAPLAQMSSVLEAGSPSTMVDRMLTLDQITKFSNGEITTAAATKSRHDAEKAQLDLVIADQTKQQQALDGQKAKIMGDIAALEVLRKKAYGDAQARAATQTTTTVKSTPPNVSGKAGVAVNFAYAQLGKPYEWAADGPGSYDCSGLTMAAWRAAGVSLPHNAAMQWSSVPHISRSALQPGDLVFYSGLNHVAIYVGNNQVIHAPTYGEPVQVASVTMMTPYGYGRPS